MRGFARRGTRRLAVVVAAALAVGTTAVAATGSGLDFGRKRTGSGAGGSRPLETATVTRQTLVERKTVDGTLGYGDATVVADRVGGTLTALPPVGQTVARGQALFRVDDEPTVLLYGRLPAYRDLAPGTEGPDVRQFEENLRKLGYTGFTVDDEYTTATATAVERWQEDLGLPGTGSVELGRVAYADGTVRVASHEATVGTLLKPGEPVLSHTGTTRVVTVDLEVTDRSMARTGAAVTCTLPSGTATPGKVISTETVVVPADGKDQESETRLRVTVGVTDAKALAGLDEATVPVAFTASQRENVLAVPVAALLALAEGGYGLQVVENDAVRIVPVETGLFAEGRVEVSGAGVAEGTTVGMPS